MGVAPLEPNASRPHGPYTRRTWRITFTLAGMSSGLLTGLLGDQRPLFPAAGALPLLVGEVVNANVGHLAREVIGERLSARLLAQVLGDGHGGRLLRREGVQLF